LARDQFIRITVTPEEKALIEKAAQDAGLPPATWLRSVALQAIRAGGTPRQ
jgi:hypothetical protein